MALFAIVLAMGLALAACPAEAAPFAYVTTGGFDGAGSVSVIDTATHPPSVVVTVPVGTFPQGVAVTPDGKHVYVANFNSNNVSVIETATNTVVATIALPVGTFPINVAVTPDGKHAYVVGNTVLVIRTATNTVVASIPVGPSPFGVAFTPDGTHAYVTNMGSTTVSVIATATKTVVATVPVGNEPFGVAVTPDGKHVYVANFFGNTVSVIRTATNTGVATIPVGTNPSGVAVTPDGQYAYVTNQSDNTVSVIATATKSVVATIPVGLIIPDWVAVTPDGKHAYVTNGNPDINGVSVIRTATNTVVATVPVSSNHLVAIVPPPPGVPFLAFSATALDIAFGAAPNDDSFNLHSQFTLSSTAPAINPVTQAVTLQVGTFSTTFPPGSFAKQLDGSFTFAGVIDGVSLKAQIRPTGTLQYTFHAKATGASLTGTKNPVYVTLTIGGDSGATSVTAEISH